MHIVFSGVGADWCYAVARQSGCACGSPQPCLVKTVRSTDLPGVRLESTRDASFDSTGAEANGGGAEFVSQPRRAAARGGVAAGPVADLRARRAWPVSAPAETRLRSIRPACS